MSKPTVTKEEISRVRILQAEIDQIQANLSTLEQQALLINSAINSLNDAVSTQNELKNKKPGEEILVPIGGSNFILCTRHPGSKRLRKSLCYSRHKPRSRYANEPRQTKALAISNCPCRVPQQSTARQSRPRVCRNGVHHATPESPLQRKSADPPRRSPPIPH